MFGLTLPASNTTSIHTPTDATLANRHVSVLAGRGMGLLGMVVTEVLAPARGNLADKKKNADVDQLQSEQLPGSILVCGLGLVGRIGREPVADLLTLNLLVYSTMTPSAAAGGVPPATLPGRFAPGDVINWGSDYASEKGVALSPTNGLLIAPCPYNATCQMGYLGNQVESISYNTCRATAMMWMGVLESTVCFCQSFATAAQRAVDAVAVCLLYPLCLHKSYCTSCVRACVGVCVCVSVTRCLECM